ncbi:PilZ domain-containing protein [Ramlibacter pallidus]|uniref:PilZ domain-containing protein n=1 Tax=Ramlibacter pallidus TaxID=2780087 RepID=A0ABR9S3I3_9BURK|nr:PilZ domain-containing protein [Ramlibacter pallidus]MBE7368061.1 PilZ domain-containing protein [Ramlibacter pallidus]
MATDGLTIPVTLHTRDERRRAERFAAAMPVSVDGNAGTTEDLSSSGLSFLADHSYEPGARVEVVIEYLLDGHQYPLTCQAEVVRVERVGERYRVGARLAAQSRLEDIQVADAGAVEPAPGVARPHLRRVD